MKYTNKIFSDSDDSENKLNKCEQSILDNTHTLQSRENNTIKHIFSYPRKFIGNSEYRWQSITCSDSAFYIIGDKTKNADGLCRIIKLSNLNFAQVDDSNNFVIYEGIRAGHANSMTYKNGYLYILPLKGYSDGTSAQTDSENKKILRIKETDLKSNYIPEIIDLTKYSCWSSVSYVETITYDSDNDCFYIQVGSSLGSGIVKTVDFKTFTWVFKSGIKGNVLSYMGLEMNDDNTSKFTGNDIFYDNGFIYKSYSYKSSGIRVDKMVLGVWNTNGEFIGTNIYPVVPGEEIESICKKENHFYSITDGTMVSVYDILQSENIANYIYDELPLKYDLNNLFNIGRFFSASKAYTINKKNLPEDFPQIGFAIDVKPVSAYLRAQEIYSINASYSRTVYVRYGYAGASSKDELWGNWILKDYGTNDITITRSSPLNGKTIWNFGDSISEGAGNAHVGPAEMVASYNDMKCSDFAVGGSGLSYHSTSKSSYYSKYSVYQKVINAISSNPSANPDFIVIGGGCNDVKLLNDSYTIESLIGSYKKPTSYIDEFSEEYINSCDISTICGALETIIYKLMMAYPKSQIIMMFVNPIFYNNNTYKNLTYENREKVCNIEKEICNKWSIPFLDMLHEGGINMAVSSHHDLFKYSEKGDYVHPNALGYKLFYVPKLTKMLESCCPYYSI